jgi:hypothetical protein
VIVRCARCGRVVGSAESYSYGGPEGEDHLDYKDLKPLENYGGEYDGEDYCEECLPLEEAEGELLREGSAMNERKFNYREFLRLVKLYRKGAINRSHFRLKWALEQRDQGINAGREGYTRPCVSR